MKNYLRIGLILVVLGLLASAGVCYHRYQSAVEENLRLKNNIEYYQNKDSSNLVLINTVKELKSTKDSILIRVDSLRDALNIKPKSVKEVVYVSSGIKDTLRDTIQVPVVQTVNFKKVFTPNNQTKITVERKDSLISVIPDIKNNQTILVYTDKQYKYKTFFSRLIHFNFSKTEKQKFTIDNSNLLIKTEESRVVNVIK